MENTVGITWAIEEMSSLSSFVTICLDGLELTVATHQGEPTEDSEYTQGDLAFAKAEARAGFPYLFGLATIRLWAMLESTIDELVVCVLHDKPEVRRLPIFHKLKGPLVEFMTSSPYEQAEYLANLLKDHVRANLHPGVGRFETMLEAITPA